MSIQSILEDMNLVFNEGVFNPDFRETYSSSIFLEEISRRNLFGKKILDLGCGTGIIGISTFFRGARDITFIDVSEKALQNTRENLRRIGLENEFKVFKSNLFANVDEKYDIIYANLPIKDEYWGKDYDCEEICRNVLESSFNYLRENGTLFYSWANFAKNSIFPRLLLEERNLNFKIVSKKELGFIWDLYEINY